MASDPQYVRLHNRLVRGMHIDLASGFGISGLDIVPFPDDPDQADHVRSGMRLGMYEAAADHEVEAFHGRESDYLSKMGIEKTPLALQATFQEGHVQELAALDRRHYEGSRGLGRNTAAAYDADQARRNALLEADGGITSTSPSVESPAPAQEAPAASGDGSDPSGKKNGK
jgi:hypothetical protein